MEITKEKKMQFLDLYSMVMADGIAHPKEMEMLYRMGKDTFGLTEEEIVEELKTSGVSTFIPELPEEKISQLYKLAQIAWADGILKDEEINLLRRYAIRYGVEDSQVDELVNYLIDKAKAEVSEQNVINELKD